jgi:hypothetical protein
MVTDTFRYDVEGVTKGLADIVIRMSRTLGARIKRKRKH